MEIFAKTLLFSCNCGKMIITFVGEKGAKNYIMHESTNDIEMTNDEYREELQKIFASVNENYKLRWFYLFVIEKIRSSN